VRRRVMNILRDARLLPAAPRTTANA